MKTEKELRELDAWIAEHLFGYVWVTFVKGDPWAGKRALEGPVMLKTSRLVVKATGTEPLADNWYDWKKFSTDPAAAMMVLEKCCGLTNCTVHQTSSGAWNVFAVQKPHVRADVFSETLPLAICLFAKQLFSK